VDYFSLFRFALKNNLPVLKHVSLPRVGALQAIVDTVGPEKSSSLGGNNNGDPTMRFDGMNYVWNFNIFNIESICKILIVVGLVVMNLIFVSIFIMVFIYKCPLFSSFTQLRS
jgi:hypothetical protein